MGRTLFHNLQSPSYDSVGLVELEMMMQLSSW